MSSLTHRWLAMLTAGVLLTLGQEAAWATPLVSQNAERETIESAQARYLSDAELLGAGSERPDTNLPDTLSFAAAMQQSSGMTSDVGGNAWTFDSSSNLGRGSAAGSPLDLFRGMVNRQPAGDARTGRQRNAPPRPNAGPDSALLGTETQEWVEDAVRGIINSAVELRVNDSGRISFSVLGLGDFGVMVSGDRNEIALVSGEDVLFSAQRDPYPRLPPQGTGNGTPGDGGFGGMPAGPATGSGGDSSLRQALDLASEIATHPLSLLVYAIVGAYALLWNILKAQGDRRTQTRLNGPRPDAPRPVHVRRSAGKHRPRRRRRI